VHALEVPVLETTERPRSLEVPALKVTKRPRARCVSPSRVRRRAVRDGRRPWGAGCVRFFFFFFFKDWTGLDKQ